MSTDNTTNFELLNLHPSILRAIQESGYTQATPIQAQAIPEVMAGHDLMASAQTGTGKTAAFTLPALNLLATPHPVKSRGPRILVLVPTRELATQVNDAARKYGKFIRARTVSIVGGMPYPLQNKLLSQPIDILVATPGRLIDHIERGRIDMSRLQMLVLDEADRMLDMGFMPDIEHICAALPAERQNLLFSATFEQSIVRVAQQILKNPKRIEIAAQTEKHENIEQRLHYVDDMGHKNKLLEHLLIDPEVNQAIIFTSTKRHADVLADDLYAAGHRTAALHGDMTQGARNRTLTKLRHGDVKVLVATDVAARGIDVAGISHVINYDLPKQAEDYVHRIGRTGRAGNTGIAISFASNADRHQVRKIEQFTGQRLEPSVIAGLEPKRAAPRNDGPRGGRSNGNKRPYGERNHNDRGQRGDRPEHFNRERSSNDRSFGQEHRFQGKDSGQTRENTGFNNGFKTRSQDGQRDGQREGNRDKRSHFADSNNNRNGNRHPRSNDDRGNKFGAQNRQRDGRHHEGRQREDAGQRRSRHYA
jgi:superfamily II DNA/RNA helicase